MNFDILRERIEDGEVAIVESINQMLPEDFVRRNSNLFSTYVVQDDIDLAGIMWIFDAGKVYANIAENN